MSIARLNSFEDRSIVVRKQHSCKPNSEHRENELFSGYCHTNVFQLLENLVNDLEVLPDEVINAWIVRDGLIRAIWVFISSGDRLDR